MVHSEEVLHLKQGYYLALSEGCVSVPLALLKSYRALGLSELEVMLMIHLITFKEKEQKEFPTIDEIQARMFAPHDQVITAIQKLLKQGWMTIDEAFDAVAGIQFERYNLQPLFERLAAYWAEQSDAVGLSKQQRDGTGARIVGGEKGAGSSDSRLPLRPAPIKPGKDVFSVFETEFARPLSPMECETITSWLDRDKYAEELILAALKEAVFAGKLHFRYIDRILLEWSRNRVFTAEQAKEYTQKFRGAR